MSVKTQKMNPTQSGLDKEEDTWKWEKKKIKEQD
jgi:hypothetical protein